ncbi:MAG: hypothetical protein RLZZ314_1732 [Bacteroidota bacterium]
MGSAHQFLPRRGGLIEANTFVCVFHSARGVFCIMFEEQHPSFIRCGVKEQLFLFQSQQGACVITHDIGQRDVPRAWQEIRHEGHGGFPRLLDQWDHLAFCVTIGKEYVPSFDAHRMARDPSFALHHVQLPRFSKG